jgi:hypothetical protein
MEALQEQLRVMEQERETARATAQSQAAQAAVDLAATQAATGGPAGQVVFALTPALASNDLINYSTGEGIKMYGKAIAPLDTLYNGDSASLRLFLSKMQQRANQSVFLIVPRAGDELDVSGEGGAQGRNCLLLACPKVQVP